MDEPWKDCAKSKKPVIEDHTLYDSIQMKVQARGLCRDKKQMSHRPGLGKDLGIREMKAKGYAVSFWGDENALKLTVTMVVHTCVYAKTVYSKWVNCIAHELYLNKVIKKRCHIWVCGLYFSNQIIGHPKWQLQFKGKMRICFRLLLSPLILYFSKYGNQTFSLWWSGEKRVFWKTTPANF